MSTPKPKLVHYVIVRRDLPLGVMCAQVVHAAGESAAQYVNDETGEPFEHAVAVVLEVEDEQALIDTQMNLVRNGVRLVPIDEEGGPYHNQQMALGLVPVEREEVAYLLEDYQTLKKSTYQGDQEADVCTCSNCQGTIRDDHKFLDFMG